jgi:hypothetical protein
MAERCRAPSVADAHGVRIYGVNGAVHIDKRTGRITAVQTPLDARTRRIARTTIDAVVRPTPTMSV